MVEKCFNPECAVPFHRMRNSKLFAFDVRALTAKALVASDEYGVKRGSACLFFWLCERCSIDATLEVDAAGCLALHRLQESHWERGCHWHDSY